MMDVFMLAGTIAINAAAAHKAIDGTTQKAENASKNINKAFSKIGSAAVACGKVVASGLAVGTAALGALLKSSIGEYAEYEQLVGGVKKLFGDSAGEVMKYANEAYKTAGLSANDYMTTLTTFSASLIKGLGGDTEKAANLADMAIADMADNANTFGMSMDTLQDAYKNFARQNYSMLDSLSLGYGGSAEGMAQLINDSGVLGDAITVTADTVKQVPFNKIIEAIHIVQTEMKITGTTAKEASTTISGSFASFKATWKNLLTGLADKDADVSTLFGNMVNAGEIVLQNVAAVLPTIKENIGIVLGELAQYIDGEMRTTVWPKIQELFKVELGVELPKWDTFKSDVTTWWNDTTSTLDTICTWFLKPGYLWTEEDDAKLRDFWDEVYAKIASICKWVLKPEFPDADTVIADLTAWWENVRKNLKLTFGITPQVEGYVSNVQDTANDLGAAGQSFVSNPDSFINFGAIWNALKPKASGMYRVPYDGYPALLHKDEAVLNRLDAREWRTANTHGGLTADNSRLEALMGNLIGLMQQVVANTGAGQNIILDSGVLVGNLAPSMDRQLGTLASRKGRG